MDTLETLAVASQLETGSDLVNDLHSAFGQHKARAVHAKGIILEGTFVPAASASSLCIAHVFSDPDTLVTVRFSDFTGIPDIPDYSENANPRGFALKCRLQDGSEIDVVAHSFDGFPTRTATEFGALLRAIGASGPGAARPTALDQFLEAHPVARTFLTSQNPAPESYATTAYFGVNAVAFTTPHGENVYVRYRFVPRAGEHYLDAYALAEKGPNYLAEEIAQRVETRPVLFDWYAQIAAPGDAVDDPSIAWSNDRPLAFIGTIRLSKLSPDEGCADKALRFRPGRFPLGIVAADPMLIIREEAYPISFNERQ